MNTVLVNPFSGGRGLNPTILPPLSLGYLAAVLENNGFKVNIIDAALERFNTNEIIKGIPSETVLLGAYMNSFNYDSVADLVSSVKKKYPEIIVVLGGPLPSASPQMVLNKIICDGVVQGEGENAILSIIRNIADGKPAFDKGVPGAVFRDEEDHVIVNASERTNHLDQLPFPAYHLMPSLKKYRVISKQRPVAPIITSRGCAHECTFCSKDVFKRKVTFRSAENVLKEIDFLVKNYGIRQIDILDDNFMQKRSRVEEILDGLISRNYGLSINLPSGVRIEQIDRALLKKMRKAGFYKIAFGVESADPEVLKRVRKKLDLQKLALTVKTAKELGFETYGFFVIGLPGETEESFNQTLDYACNTGFDVANFCIAIPFVGTELFDLVQKHGRFLMSTTGNLNEGFYGGKAFYELGSVKESDVVRRYKTAYKRFYTWKKKIQLLSKIRSIQDIYWLYNAFKSIT